MQLANELPFNDYYEYFGPEYSLFVPPTNMENKNTPRYLDEVKLVRSVFRHIYACTIHNINGEQEYA